MKTNPAKIEHIHRIASTLGVSRYSLSKWRQRGVPHKWRIPIMAAAAGAIVPQDFEHPTSPRLSSPVGRSLSPASDGVGELSPAGASAHVRGASPVAAHGEGAYGVVRSSPSGAK